MSATNGSYSAFLTRSPSGVSSCTSSGSASRRLRGGAAVLRRPRLSRRSCLRCVAVCARQCSPRSRVLLRRSGPRGSPGSQCGSPDPVPVHGVGATRPGTGVTGAPASALHRGTLPSAPHYCETPFDLRFCLDFQVNRESREQPLVTALQGAGTTARYPGDPGHGKSLPEAGLAHAYDTDRVREEGKSGYCRVGEDGPRSGRRGGYGHRRAGTVSGQPARRRGATAAWTAASRTSRDRKRLSVTSGSSAARPCPSIWRVPRSSVPPLCPTRPRWAPSSASTPPGPR